MNPIDQECIIKFWSDAGCSGTATTFYFGRRDSPVKCFASVSNGGTQKLPNGAKSVISNCAFDAVPI